MTIPLPEQSGWAVEMHGVCVLFANNAERANGARPGATTQVYTADQLRAYAQQFADAAVAAERERIASLAVDVARAMAEKYKDDHEPVKQPYANNRLLHVGWAIADAIRATPEGT